MYEEDEESCIMRSFVLHSPKIMRWTVYVEYFVGEEKRVLRFGGKI